MTPDGRAPCLAVVGPGEDRLLRLRRDTRDLLRLLTRDGAGEEVWDRHVQDLREEDGTLLLGVSHALEDGPWFVVVAAAVARAWDGPRDKVVFVLPDGYHLPLETVLPARPGA